MSDILECFSLELDKDLIESGVWPKKYGQTPSWKKRRSVCVNLFFEKVLNRNLQFGQDLADKTKKF